MQLLDDVNATVVTALQDLLEFSPNYGWVGKPDLATGVRHVIEKADEGNAFIGHGYLLLVGEFEPWYGSDKIMQEELILRLPQQREYRLNRVIGFLTALAEVRKSNLLLVGNSYITPALSNIYQSRHGFKPCSTILYKDIHNG